jgi:hypothetical protein
MPARRFTPFTTGMLILERRFGLTRWVGRTNKLPRGNLSLKNQGLSPIGIRAASNYYLLQIVNPQNRDVLAMCRPASCKGSASAT